MENDWKFPWLLLGIKPQIQESQKIRSRINTKNHISTVIFQLQKIQDKEKWFWRNPGRWGKHLTCERTNIKIISDFSLETMHARETFTVLGGKKTKRETPTGNYISCENTLFNWQRNKDFLGQTKIKDIFASRPALQEMLKRGTSEKGKFRLT